MNRTAKAAIIVVAVSCLLSLSLVLASGDDPLLAVLREIVAILKETNGLLSQQNKLLEQQIILQQSILKELQAMNNITSAEPFVAYLFPQKFAEPFVAYLSPSTVHEGEVFALVIQVNSPDVYVRFDFSGGATCLGTALPEVLPQPYDYRHWGELEPQDSNGYYLVPENWLGKHTIYFMADKVTAITDRLEFKYSWCRAGQPPQSTTLILTVLPMEAPPQ